MINTDEIWIPLTAEQTINQAFDVDINIYVNDPVTHGILSQYAANDFDLPIEDIEIVFEHGHYWCQFINTDGELEQYSVVESNQGIEFEEI
ncbi:MAG: hypothetical protein AAFY41_11615 [Bacteroidota bacterium]